jgi:peptidoglycan/xylan/chitin deacetylase (PgdA/CDA1 family)
MSVDELRALAAGGLIELGAHTASHPALTSLGVEQQRAEIVASRDWLRETLNVPAATFAYPHGDYSAETVDVVRAAGFSCACSCATATVTARSDPFQLPRFGVPDVDGDRFAGLLAEWFAM